MSHPVPFEVARLRGFPGKQGKRSPGPRPERTEQLPEPPAFLMPAAKAEWHQRAGELHALGLLASLDVMLFAAYCQSVARWLLAEELLAKAIADAAADGDDGGGLLVAGAKGGLVVNPLLRVTADAAMAMLRLAGEFGLGPAARARIAAGAGWQPPDKTPSKWSGLLA
jgi:P27 family predicted phage terminase small subunit